MYVEFYESDQRMTAEASRRNAAAADARMAADDAALQRFEAYWNAAYKTQEERKTAEARATS